MPISLYVAGVSAFLLLWCLWRRHAKTGSHGIAIPFLVVMAIWFGWIGWQKYSTEKAVTRAVRAVTGEPDLYVVCRSWLNFADTHAGWVKGTAKGEAENKAALSRDTCKALRNWLRSAKRNPTMAQVAAVGVVAHETGHMQGGGEFNELAAECWGVQHVEEMAVELGATPGQAWSLAQRYWAAVHPRLPDKYQGAECSENGPLDETPGDNHWP